MTIIARGVSTVKLVGEVYKRRPIQDRFTGLSLKAHIWGTNISICKQLSIDQYENFMGFLKVIIDFAKTNFVIGEKQLLPLDLPAVVKLKQINFDRLQANEVAMKDVRDMCVLPDGRPIIDLRLLPKIYQSHISSK